MRDRDSKWRHSRKRWIILFAALFFFVTSYFVLCRVFPEETKRLRVQLRESVEQEFPDLAAKVRSRYGINPADEDDPGGSQVGRNVILVHGLDDPGKVWINLLPRLKERGFHVSIFSYPDDQPVSDSARFLFDEMRALRKRGVPRASIVAHSMGGLVAREMLTHPEMSYGSAVRDGLVPDVSALIMIGTPNHGSELAPLRFVGELRDQFSGLLSGDYVWIEGIVDGTGEAGIDLTPGSAFLDELNKRPHPESLRMAVIAGVIDPLTSESIRKSGAGLLEGGSTSAQEQGRAALKFLDSMALKLGDGLVSVDSAGLNGYPLHIVEGTHLSIIRNTSGKSERIPPAVPVVIDYLENPESYWPPVVEIQQSGATGAINGP